MLQNSASRSFVDLTITNEASKSLAHWKLVSNFYKITLTVLKSSFVKQKPRVLNYRNNKFLSNTLFRKVGLCEQIQKFCKTVKTFFSKKSNNLEKKISY